MDREALAQARMTRAKAIQAAGGIEQAIAAGTLPRCVDITLSEAVVLGLVRQDVRTFVGIFGHGSTEMGEVLRIYEAAGVVQHLRRAPRDRGHPRRLRPALGDRRKGRVFTSIGPGALHALAGSLVAASDGLGVWFMLGDETTEDEGANMQQIPKARAGFVLAPVATMGRGLQPAHAPGAEHGTACGMNVVDHPYRAGPFYLLLPMNEQSVAIIPQFNLDELPVGHRHRWAQPRTTAATTRPADKILAAERVVVRVGGGGRHAGPELPRVPRPGRWRGRGQPRGLRRHPLRASAQHDAGGLQRLALRQLCQRGGRPGGRHRHARRVPVGLVAHAVHQGQQVININGDLDTATHYNQTHRPGGRHPRHAGRA